MQIIPISWISGVVPMNREWFINVAVSFDGKISNPGEQVEISCDEDWNVVHNMRNTIAAILVGSNTIIVDNPSLLTKEKYISEGDINHPVRIILDRRGRCLPTAKVFQDQQISQTIWVSESEVSIPGVHKIATTDLEVIILKVNQFLNSIGKKGDVMIEGGSQVIMNFINSGLVSHMRLYRGNIVLPKGVSLFSRDIGKKMILKDTYLLGNGHVELYNFE